MSHSINASVVSSAPLGQATFPARTTLEIHMVTLEVDNVSSATFGSVDLREHLSLFDRSAHVFRIRSDTKRSMFLPPALAIFKTAGQPDFEIRLVREEKIIQVIKTRIIYLALDADQCRELLLLHEESGGNLLSPAPSANARFAKDPVYDLTYYAEQVDFFRVNSGPEVAQHDLVVCSVIAGVGLPSSVHYVVLVI